MKIGIQAQGKWPLTSCAIVSDTNNLHMHLRELVKGLGWRIDDPPAPADIALAYLENGSSFAFIVEDTPTMPAYESIRAIMNHPIGRLTPILAMLTEASSADHLIFQRILLVGTARKPLTPNQFIPAFKEVIALWQQPIYVALRKCAYAMLNGDVDAIIPVLEKLTTVPQVAPLAVQSLSQIYAKRNKWDIAEKTVLEAIKSHPKIPSLIMTVANFYMEARMPAQALRFYQKLQTISKNSPLYAFDIAHAAMTMGQLDVAIAALSEWNNQRPGNEQVVQFLARLYMAEGRESSSEKTLNMNKASLKRIQEVWEKSESAQSNPAIPSAS